MSETNCPVCGGTTRSYIKGTVEMATYFSSDVPYMIAAGERDQLDVRTCEECGHGFVPITVSESDIDAWYAKAPADTLFISEQDARRKTARVVLDRLDRLVPEKGRLLDVGSGPGFFVDEAIKRGWKGLGLEPSQWANSWGANNLGLSTVRAGTYHDLEGYEAESCTVLTVFDVIEHVVNPYAFLAACARVVTPGGYVALTTPKLDSGLARLMGSRWYCIIPAHLHYFTLESLRYVLEKQGFSVVEVKTHTRYLSVGYFQRRLFDFLGIPNNRGNGTSLSMLLPINFGDELEIYVQKKDS